MKQKSLQIEQKAEKEQKPGERTVVMDPDVVLIVTKTKTKNLCPAYKKHIRVRQEVKKKVSQARMNHYTAITAAATAAPTVAVAATAGQMLATIVHLASLRKKALQY